MKVLQRYDVAYMSRNGTDYQQRICVMAFVLNIAPIEFGGSTIKVEVFNYDEDKLNQLREQSRGTHFVRREGRRIICVALKPNLPPLGGSDEEVDLSQHLSLVAALAREAMYRQLLAQNCWINKVRPISYLVTKRNILKDCLPAGVDFQNGIGVFPQWELDFRVFDPTGQQAFVGMSLNVKTASRISLRCDELIRLGVPIQGLYVGRAYPGRNPELKPRFTTLGRIAEIIPQDIPLIRLDDVRGDYNSVESSSKLFLEPREDILEHCVRCIYGNYATQILSNLDRLTTAFHTGPSKLRRLQSGLSSFQSLDLELIPGIPYSINPFLNNHPNNPTLPNLSKAPFPTFVFSPGGQKVDSWNDQGL
nr:hypothetical protein [Tanacetum cinerariifolium]